MYGSLPTASTFARFYPVIMGLSTHSMKACLIKPHLDERNTCRKPTIDSRDHCLLISTQSTQSTPDCLYPDFGLVKASAIHRSNRRFAEDHCFPCHCVAGALGALGALGAGAWPCPPILSGGLDSVFRNPKKNQKEAEKCAFPGCYIVRWYFPTIFPGFQPFTFFELLLLRQGEGQVWVEHSDFSLQTPLISRGITKRCWKQMVTGSNLARSLGNGNLYSSPIMFPGWMAICHMNFIFSPQLSFIRSPPWGCRNRRCVWSLDPGRNPGSWEISKMDAMGHEKIHRKVFGMKFKSWKSVFHVCLWASKIWRMSWASLSPGMCVVEWR